MQIGAFECRLKQEQMVKLAPNLRAWRAGEPWEIETEFSAEIQDRDSALRELEILYRDDILRLPGPAPAFDADAALWAAATTAFALQFAVVRDIDARQVERSFSRPEPGADSAATVYSVDLTMRLLPGICGYAKSISRDDPLNVQLTRLCSVWPLSSVGAGEIPTSDITVLLNNETLMRLYVDRVIDSKDYNRMDHPQVAMHVREALGLYPELAPAMQTWLNKREAESNTAEAAEPES